MIYQGSSDMTHKNMSISQITKKSDNAMMKDASSDQKKVEIMQPAILKSSLNSKKQGSDKIFSGDTQKEVGVSPFNIDASNTLSVSEQIQNEMENRKKIWMKNYKTKLDLNDVLEIRNP